MGTRDRLIACARDLLAADGVEAVTVRRIARAAGVSHGAPLRHFPNRTALLSAVAATGFAELSNRLQALEPGEPRARLAAACESYVDFARGAPALFELMFRPGMAPLGAVVFTQFRCLVTALPAADVVATSLWASLRGLALLPDAHDVLAATLDVYVR